MKTYNDFKPETLSLLTALLAAKFVLRWIDDGGDEQIPFTTVEKAVEDLTAVDEARLFATTPSGKKVQLYLVYGNSPGELVADWTMDPELDAVLSAESDKWEGAAQPLEYKE